VFSLVLTPSFLHKTRVHFWSWWDRPVADWAKASGAKQFLFISSAGIYKSTDEPPHVEGVRPLKPYLHSCFPHYVLMGCFDDVSNGRSNGRETVCQTILSDYIIRKLC